MLHTANHSECVIGSGEEKYSGVMKELLRSGKNFAKHCVHDPLTRVDVCFFAVSPAVLPDLMNVAGRLGIQFPEGSRRYLVFTRKYAGKRLL